MLEPVEAHVVAYVSVVVVVVVFVAVVVLVVVVVWRIRIPSLIIQFAKDETRQLADRTDYGSQSILSDGSIPGWSHLRVSLDHFSHQTGNRRAFTYCTHHKACRLYVFIKDFDSKAHAAAYLFTWRMAAHRWNDPNDAKKHIECKPCINRVEMVYR